MRSDSQGCTVRCRKRLLEAAWEALPRAYAPYSNYSVAAAILDESGRVFVGVNVENVSYGLTLCAERVAVGAMVAAGGRRVRAVAIVARGSAPPMPCGACRQVLAELGAPDTIVWVGSGDGKTTRFRLGALLPHRFHLESVGRPWRESRRVGRP